MARIMTKKEFIKRLNLKNLIKIRKWINSDLRLLHSKERVKIVEISN